MVNGTSFTMVNDLPWADEFTTNSRFFNLLISIVRIIVVEERLFNDNSFAISKLQNFHILEEDLLNILLNLLLFLL
jgi:hypothetical protein